MTQQNNEFEKWATKHIVSKRLLEFNILKYENGNYKSHIMQRKFEAWQAATAEREKRIAELQAHINVLREALENLHDDIAEYQKLNNIGGYENQCMKQARQALAKTPTQSLQVRDDEVIERCAKACENLITESFSKPLSFDDIAIAIRALKGKYE